jgi:hypothetical protein
VRRARVQVTQAQGRRPVPRAGGRGDQGAARGLRPGRAPAIRPERLVELRDRCAAGPGDGRAARVLRGPGPGPGGHGAAADRGAAAPGNEHVHDPLRASSVKRPPGLGGRDPRRSPRVGRPAAVRGARPLLPDLRTRPVDALQQPPRRLARGYGPPGRGGPEPHLRRRHALPVAERRGDRGRPPQVRGGRAGGPARAGAPTRTERARGCRESTPCPGPGSSSRGSSP